MSVAIASPLRYSHTIGLMAHGGKGFSNPVDLAVGKNGVLYVANRSNPTQGPAGGIRVGMVTIDEEYLGEFGSAGDGDGDGQFTWLTAVAVDSGGDVYVADEYRHDIQVFDKDGTFLRTWGGFGAADGQLNRPCGLAADADDNVYVADHLNHRIQKCRPDGTVVGPLGRQGSGPGELNLPW